MWAIDKASSVWYDKGRMNHTLTLDAQALIDELAQNGVTLQELAPIVGRAAEIADEVGWDMIRAKHIEQAIKERKAEDGIT